MNSRSPQTPTARKAPSTTTSSKSRSRKASTSGGQKSRAKNKDGASEYSPPSGKKRKAKSETASTKNATPKSKSAGARGKVNMMTPEKKQKVVHKGRSELIDDATVSFLSLESQPRLQFPTPHHTPFHTPTTSTPAFVDLSNEAPSTLHELAYYMPQEPHPQHQSSLNMDFQQQQQPQAFNARRDSQASSPGRSQAQQSPLSMGFQGQQSPFNAPEQPWVSIFGSPHQPQLSPLNTSSKRQGSSLSGSPRERQQSASSAASASGVDHFEDDFGKGFDKLDDLVLRVLQRLPLAGLGCLKSDMIDKITYNIHNVCIQSGAINVAAKYAAMFSETKLRALAMLNFMATWWLLRERVLVNLKHRWVNFDDTVMQSGIKDAVATVVELIPELRRKMKGKGNGNAEKEKASMGFDNSQ